ncbi:MAG: ubiquinone biosynthesis regulatory protein kinase UbiB [Thiofilum sp.]|uniref:ubiquinone biosynthesis regulatory protein kinase UbiB n=1 Tax=Thiofilum sp. TaxID=2212733 RepID=UPI0025F56D0F|nr:ubiquinone biosynthesis regulatory protein kinase UbiB [Thiofilum sp.]MBK8452319.1 ubiquinone biosynthesis regulatory protein kinase UbiB [Thiofilum sp.]
MIAPIKGLRRLMRLWSIIRVIIQQGLDELFFSIPLLRPVSFIYKLLPWNWVQHEQAPLGVRIRVALEELGPVFIKFGQMLSTRRDLLPDDIALELSRLQDRVPPFASNEARAIIEKAYGQSLNTVFQQFDSEPLASASMAQVHAATLWSGQEVVVKVLRPNLLKTIQQDIEVMYLFAGLVQRYWSEGKRLHPVEIVREYEKTILDELDMQREAANASQLRRNFEGSPDLYVPAIDWQYTRDNVMVMERIYGIPVGDIERLRSLNINFKRLAERGVEIFFTQVFRHNFFHADMHPGNIFVETHNPDDPRYIAVDFGIVGTLSNEDQRYLAENFYAFFNRDYKRVAELHVESGWVPATTRVEELEAAIRTVCEPIFQQPLKDISFGYVLLRLFQTARRFNMEVQPQLVLLQKTLLNIEGLGRQLYPDLDLWATAKPFLQRWMDEQVGIRALWKGVKINAPKFLEQLPYMPSLLHDLAQQAVQHKLTTRFESEQLELLRQQLQYQQRTLVYVLLGGILLISALLVPSNWQLMSWWGISSLSWGLGGMGLGLLIYSVMRSQPKQWST